MKEDKDFHRVKRWILKSTYHTCYDMEVFAIGDQIFFQLEIPSKRIVPFSKTLWHYKPGSGLTNRRNLSYYRMYLYNSWQVVDPDLEDKKQD